MADASKTSLKCSLGALVSGTKLRFSKKKFTFSPPSEPPSLSRAFGSSSLTTIDHFCRGICGELLPSMRPRHQGSAHDVILTGLDEEGDSTNEEMPPLEPLEGGFCVAFWELPSAPPPILLGKFY